MLEDLGVRLRVVHRKPGSPLGVSDDRRAELWVVGKAGLVGGKAEKRDEAMPLLGRDRCELIPQLTAFFKSAAILASSVAVNSFSAKAVGHMAPLSSFASSLKPNVAYLDLNLSALWK